MVKHLLEVVENHCIADKIFLLKVAADKSQWQSAPGQFVHVKCGQGVYPLLRRPLSICDWDEEKEELSIIYRVDGEGTKLLAERQVGEKVDILGALGSGFPISHRQVGEKVLLVGGGVGVPPLYYVSKQLRAKGVEVTHILGFQSNAQAFFIPEFTELGETYVSTVDGSLGTKGFVTDVIEQLASQWDAVYSCGPIPMLKALSERFSEHEAYISLEQRMGCGVGACLACVCKTTTQPGYKKICLDGPVFKVGEVMV